MNLVDILPAIAKITANPVIHDLRSITYLATYPSILALGTAGVPIALDRLHQVAAMAYGWMPRVVRIDPLHTANALVALNALSALRVAAANPMTPRPVGVADVAACLHSLVGASKVLHFVNDSVFPIWDSRIETYRLRLRLDRTPPHNHMNNIANYWSYFDDVHAIRLDPAFTNFFAQFTVALNIRLAALRIAPYTISDVRAIEAAAFELAP